MKWRELNQEISGEKEMNEFQIQALKKARILFVVDGCPKCRIWKSFIHRGNTEVSISKRVDVQDWTLCMDFGIKNCIYLLYKKYVSEENGGVNFPILVFDGTIHFCFKFTRGQAEKVLNTLFHKDFIIPQENKHLFNKVCTYERKGLFKGRGLVCQNIDEGDEDYVN